MAAAYQDRIDRLNMLAALIPRNVGKERCPDPRLLLEKMQAKYVAHKSEQSRLRAIQRDLAELLRDERIEVVDPNEKPRRYRRRIEQVERDAMQWGYARTKIEELLSDEYLMGPIELVVNRVLNDGSEIKLGDDKLRIVSDTQRLVPAAIIPSVLADAIEALVHKQTLHVRYRDSKNNVTEPTLHPQALLQRGPRAYLFAMKNDESLVRLYALHRVIRSSLGEAPVRAATGFDLSRAIVDGVADFGQGQQIELVLRARSYVADLLRDCQLNPSQRIEDEPEGSTFELRVSATVPSTGQLLRWLLGFGDKLEVLAPAELRAVMAAQVKKTAEIYAQTSPAAP